MVPVHIAEVCKDIIFVPDDHKYFYKGEEYPSVTRIIASVYLLKYSSNSFASDVGSLIHQILADHDNGTLATVSETYEDYLTSWEAALSGLDVSFVGIEFPVVHTIDKYAGTVDRLAIQNGEHMVIDIKTGKEAEWHPIQIVAYAKALTFMSEGWINPQKGAIVYLQPGNVSINEFEIKAYEKKWSDVLLAYQKAQGII